MIALAPLVAVFQLSSAPTTVRIPDEVTCRSCNIKVSVSAKLTAPSSTDEIGRLSSLARRSDGTYVVSSNLGTSIMLFSPTGAFVRAYGRKGDGPGEFRKISQLHVGTADTLFVVDVRRIHVFSPQLHHVRTVPVSGTVLNLDHRRDGRLVVAMDLTTPDAIGYPLHVLTPTGSVIRSYGHSGKPEFHPRCDTCRTLMSPAANGESVFLWKVNRYAWEEWRDDGSLSRKYEVASKWFAPWSRGTDYLSGAELRQPSISQVLLGPTATWVLGVKAPNGWHRKALPEDAGITFAGGTILSRSTAALGDFLYAHEQVDQETFLEAIDLVNGQLLASARFPGVMRLLSASYAARLVRDSDGNYSAEILRLEFIRR
jgi:hypothetical protein